jgi:hypothetical protein
MRMLWILAALILASCAPPKTAGDAPTGTTTGTSTSTSTSTSNKDDPQACVARGGTMRRICLMGELACVENYADAGKACTDKKQCFGQCRYAGSAAPGASVVGECQRTTDPCGCFGTVANGKFEGTLCVD